MGMMPKREALQAARRLSGEAVARLCTRYDGLLDDPARTLAPEHLSELQALALVYDLDGVVDAAPADIWRAVRPVVTRQAPGDAPEPQARAPMTVLVVEDDPDTAAGLVEILTEAGHRPVGPFPAVAAARAAAAAHRLDAALIDVNLAGDETGVDLARELKQTWGAPCVFLSGDVAQAARHAGDVAGVVFKPYSGHEVIAALDRIAAGL